MYGGYLALGGDTLQEQTFELMNTMRVQEYVENWNLKSRQEGKPEQCLGWLDPCDDCDSAAFLFTNGEGYLLPEADPAPWYDPAVRDSEKFFGVMGLEVTGAEDSTRTADVRASVIGGGAVSRLRFGPREIVVRGLAVAADDCGMEVGLNWLRCQYETTIDECGRDLLWYLDCCPNCATDPNAPPVSPCWPDTYEELVTGPADCPEGVCWIANYDEFIIGPAAGAYETCGWCAWIVIYDQVITGLPQFSCDVQECLTPYLRNFQNVRVTEGPIILSRTQMNTGGEIAEIEFTIACSDPHEYTPEVVVVEVGPLEPSAQVQDEPVQIQPVDPFRPEPVIPRGPSNNLALPANWERSTVQLNAPRITSLSSLVPSILLAAPDESQDYPIRVGVWDGDDLVGGYVLPYLPGQTTVEVNARTHNVVTGFDGTEKVFNGFARGYTGGGLVSWGDLDAGKDYTITVDQQLGDAVELLVEVMASEKGCA